MSAQGICDGELGRTLLNIRKVEEGNPDEAHTGTEDSFRGTSPRSGAGPPAQADRGGRRDEGGGTCGQGIPRILAEGYLDPLSQRRGSPPTRGGATRRRSVQ